MSSLDLSSLQEMFKGVQEAEMDSDTPRELSTPGAAAIKITELWRSYSEPHRFNSGDAVRFKDGLTIVPTESVGRVMIFQRYLRMNYPLDVLYIAESINKTHTCNPDCLAWYIVLENSLMMSTVVDSKLLMPVPESEMRTLLTPSLDKT